ncbi:hypothetical protein [Tenacibaculum halocynthiae]|uniref:hypothetical protein n=1 Tax=Tenacibaculum halocynthiae TaxID=1254437 RepID=UPI003D655C05
MTLGHRLQELRKKVNPSQNDLVSKIETSCSPISRPEIKDIQSPTDFSKRLDDEFYVSIDYIINSNLQEKTKSTLSGTELLQQFKEVLIIDDSDNKHPQKTNYSFITKCKTQSIL